MVMAMKKIVKRRTFEGRLFAAAFIASTSLATTSGQIRVREFPIVVAPGNQLSPSIDGKIVAWLNSRARPRGGESWLHGMDVYAKSLTSGRQMRLTIRPSAVAGPVISGEVIAWQDCRDCRQVQNPVGYTGSRIFAKNLATGREIVVARRSQDQFAPAVSGNILVWVDHLKRRWSVFGKNLATGREFQVARTRSMTPSPAISGNIVVWVDRKRGGQEVILGKNLRTGKTFQVAGPERSTVLSDPKISGNRVIWTSSHSLSNAVSIDSKELSSGKLFRAVTIASNRYNPEQGPDESISGPVIVWQAASHELSPSNPNFDIFAYDMSTGRRFHISQPGYSNEAPDISGRTLVWARARRSAGDWRYLSSHIRGASLSP
jgi:hypothetical protein